MLLPLVASLAASPAAAQVASSLLGLTGNKRVKLVWQQDTSSAGDHPQGNANVFKLYGYDTADDTVRVINGTVDDYTKPLFTHDGTRIVYTDWVQSSVRVINWDGSGQRNVATGFAGAVWYDAASGKEWVYYKEGSSSGPLKRVNLDSTGEKQLVWDNTNFDTKWMAISSDGARIAATWPWPNGGMIQPDLAGGGNGNIWAYPDYYINGCWTTITPDTRYHVGVFDGPHRGWRVWSSPTGSMRQVDLHSAPGIDGWEIYHPKFSNNARFLVMTGPYSVGSMGANNIGAGGPQVEIYFGKVDSGFTQVTSWVKVTSNSKADFYPDAWVDPGTPQVSIGAFSVSPTSIQSGSSATLSWSTSNATSVSIDQGIGAVSTSGSREVSPSSTTTYTLTAQGAGGPVTRQVTLTVTAPPPTPTLTLSPTALSFTATQGGGNPANKSVAVSNSSTGTLDSVSASESAGWLTVTRSGSGNGQTLTNAVDISGLAAGSYSTTVTVSCPNATNSPQSYSVALTVEAPAPTPALALSPTSLAFSATRGGGNPASKSVSVSNGGTGTLDSVSTSESAGWLTVTRSGSGNSQTLTNAVDIAGLAAGSYSTTVAVGCPNATNAPQSYTVDLTVREQLRVASVEVTAELERTYPGRSVALLARCLDQNGAPIAEQVTWSTSGGGEVLPDGGGAAASEHTGAFVPDGQSGLFAISAEAGGTTGSVTIEVSELILPLTVNCGDNAYDVADWWQDDPFVFGGSDWTNPNSVATAGVANAAPDDVYRSVRHLGPHSYEIPVPDGHYLLRLHFADAYTGRDMDYWVEGQQVLSHFDIASEAGGVNIALVKELYVVVADGDGLQIDADGVNDVFEAGLELIPVTAPDAGVADNAAAPVDAGAHDAATLPDTASGPDAGSQDSGAADAGDVADADPGVDQGGDVDAGDVDPGADAAAGGDVDQEQPVDAAVGPGTQDAGPAAPVMGVYQIGDGLACSAHHAPSPLAACLVLALCWLRRRRARWS